MHSYGYLPFIEPNPRFVPREPYSSIALNLDRARVITGDLTLDAFTRAARDYAATGYGTIGGWRNDAAAVLEKNGNQANVSDPNVWALIKNACYHGVLFQLDPRARTVKEASFWDGGLSPMDMAKHDHDATAGPEFFAKQKRSETLADVRLQIALNKVHSKGPEPGVPCSGAPSAMRKVASGARQGGVPARPVSTNREVAEQQDSARHSIDAHPESMLLDVTPHPALGGFGPEEFAAQRDRIMHDRTPREFALLQFSRAYRSTPAQPIETLAARR
jgi:hypothetical protein